MSKGCKCCKCRRNAWEKVSSETCMFLLRRESVQRLTSNVSILMHRNIKQEKREVQVQSQVYDTIRMPQTWWDSMHAWHTAMDG